VLMSGPGLSVAELADLGVRRVSIGGALARVAWGAMLKVADEIKRGAFDGLANGVPGKTLNGIFGDFTLPGRK
jgi:2-methylisocitrate lyase-like PEP mutase family enzyme